MSSANGKPPKGIPFIAELAHGGERDARMELQRLTALKAPSPAEAALRVELERYLADPFTAAAQDQDAREKVFNTLLDNAEQRVAPFVKGRKPGSVGKRTPILEQKFDALYRANPDCSAEEARTLKARGNLGKMPRATFAKHWNSAKKRAN